MDEDGNGQIDRTEMFNFMKKKEFVAPNEPAKIVKTKTKTETELAGGLAKKPSVPEGISLTKEAEKRINSMKADMGTLQIAKVSEKLTQSCDDKGNTYEGQRDPNGKESGYGIKMHADGALYVGEWMNGKCSGKGWFFHADGDTYKGDWVNDKAEGKGIYRHANGASYDGSWKADL